MPRPPFHTAHGSDDLTVPDLGASKLQFVDSVLEGLNARHDQKGCLGPNNFDDMSQFVHFWEGLQQHLKLESLVAAQRHQEVLSQLQEKCTNMQTQLQGRPSPKLFDTEISMAEVAASNGSDCPPPSQVHMASDPAENEAEAEMVMVEKTLSDGQELVKESLSRYSNRSLRKIESRLPFSGRWLHRIIHDDRFEICIATMIFLNAIALCAEVQYTGLDVGFDLRFQGMTRDAKTTWPATETFLTITDWLFGSLFLLEAIVKIAVMHRAYFRDAWSWLDLLCVAAFIIDKCAASVSPVDGKSLRTLRLFRLLRLTQLFRAMETFDSLFIMTTAIKGMKHIVFWAVTLLLTILTMVALLLTPILHATYFSDVEASKLTPVELERYHKMYEYFGNVTRSLFSMFELTLANYPVPARLLIEEVSEWFMLFILMHKLTVGFAVVGVLNGTILQETFKVASIDDTVMVRQKSRAASLIKQKLMGLCEALDIDKDGEIEFDEFQCLAEHPEIQLWLSAMGIETDDLQTLFALVDADGNGTISVDEFTTRLPRISGAAKGVDVMALAYKLQRSKVNMPDLHNGDHGDHLTTRVRSNEAEDL